MAKAVVHTCGVKAQGTCKPTMGGWKVRVTAKKSLNSPPHSKHSCKACSDNVRNGRPQQALIA